MGKKPTVALVLGGGGARGMAHIGVLKVLEEANIPIDLIVGTSSGALVGAMYAVSQNTSQIMRRFDEFINSKTYNHTGVPKFLLKKDAENFWGQVASNLGERIIINLAYSRTGLLERKRLRDAVNFLIDPIQISDTRIPFVAVAVDLNSGKEIIFEKGNLRTAAEASSSLPGFLPPLKLNSYALVDGAVLYTVPVIPARKLGADFIIAVNVSQSLGKNPELDNVIDILFRANSIMSWKYSQLQMKRADVILRPDVGNVHWSEFSLFKELVRKGEQIALDALPVIQKKLKDRFRLSRRLFRRKREAIWVDSKGMKVFDAEE